MTEHNLRVRFAPSPTGPLHIGGVRTALYNYLLAKKHKGTFILRIEDTDQTRYVPGAEQYIKEALEWLGLHPDEGPDQGGSFGPYRQSDRKALYRKYADDLVRNGKAYYAFDSDASLAELRLEYESRKETFKYSAVNRDGLDNSLSMDKDALEKRLQSGDPYTIRLKVEPHQKVVVRDLIRGEVVFDSSELDDKIMLKSDGMPTYHLANIVDDHLMKITHVIRGEEWLPSTAHHVLLYEAFGWKEVMPQFAHLPLILKPNGKGKLSKRDGAKFGIPVFPLEWSPEGDQEQFPGFREFGFLPEAVNNFLAFLGWNPGTEQELFSLSQLIDAFSVERINKSGARFDYDKAKWFNQQYISGCEVSKLAELVKPVLEAHGHSPEQPFLSAFCSLMKERVQTIPEFWDKGYYFFEEVKEYDDKTVKKKFKPERKALYSELVDRIAAINSWNAQDIEAEVKSFMADHELGFGDVLPILRIALAGTMKGPGVFEMAELLGKAEVLDRLNKGIAYAENYHAQKA